MPQLPRYCWRRHEGNPILPPVAGSAYDSRRCMTPCVVRVDDVYRLYYAGADDEGVQRICLATAPVERPTEFTRHGVVLDVGRRGDYDGWWLITPRVVKIGERWHMYFATNRGSFASDGIQSFSGIGLALSDDGLTWTKHGDGPLITGDQTAEYPENRGIGGGGPPVACPHPDGGVEYRMYYSLAVGRPDPDPRINQHKLGVVCHSRDGFDWYDHRIVLEPRRDITRENCGANFPVVWPEDGGYRMIHCCIGTRWGAYSMAEAWSEDGYTWDRGEGDQNIALAPTGDGWESKMVEYPAIVHEPGLLRMYYNGNGYGATGIGMAVADI